MANEQRGEVSITLQGKAYTLRPSFAAIAAIERRTGCGIMLLAQKFLSVSFGLSDAVTVMEECAKAADTPLPADAGEIIRQEGLEGLALPLMQLVTAAIRGDAPAKDGEAGEVQAANR